MIPLLLLLTLLASIVFWLHQTGTRTQPRRMSVFSEILAHETGSFPKKTECPPTTIHGAIFLEKLPPLESLIALFQEKIKSEERFMSTIAYDFRRSKYDFVPAKGDIDFHGHHVIQATVSDEDGIRAYVESTFHRTWKKEIAEGRPLWYFHLIENTGGLSAIVLELHHAIGDGMSLVLFFSTLYTDKDGQNLPTPKATKSISKSKTRVNPYYAAAVIVRAFFKIVLGSVIMEDTQTLIKTPHKGYVYDRGVRKIIQFPPMSLEAVKDIKNALGCSVNDIMTSVLGGALRRYLRHRNDPFIHYPLLQIRALMPYGFPRRAASPDQPQPILKNGWTLISVPLSVRATPTATARAKETQATMDMIKLSGEPYIASTLQDLVYNVAGYDVAAQIQADFVFRHTMTFTNVPAFDKNPYICGERILHVQPYVCNAVPQMSIMSCAGGLYGNFVVNPETFVEAELLGQFVVKELEELAKENGVTTPILLQV
ncbi:hypothetical protein BJ741DRAFT_581410 [Chytriomyces cf. hyalinus JEL632]|nr:hypothetical protein BJ741DRAFT_581410 [Chytriomyces cf. hyalinus JEL632]